MELFPAQESTALKTLLEAVLKSSETNLNEISCDLPAPSPKPMPTMVSPLKLPVCLCAIFAFLLPNLFC